MQAALLLAWQAHPTRNRGLVRMQQAGPIRFDVLGSRLVLSTRMLVPAYLALVVVAFLYFYPVWTALPISDNSYLSGFPLGKMWLRTWI